MKLKTTIMFSLFALFANSTNAQSSQDLIDAIQQKPVLEKVKLSTDNLFVSTDVTFPFASASPLVSALSTKTNQEPLTVAPEAITLESSSANEAVDHYASRATNTAHPSCPLATANTNITLNFTQANTLKCVSIIAKTKLKIEAFLKKIPQGNNYDLYLFRYKDGSLSRVSYSVKGANQDERLIYPAELGEAFVLAAHAKQLQTAGAARMSFQTHNLKGMDRYEFNDTKDDATFMIMNMYTPVVRVDHLSDVDYYRYRVSGVQHQVGVYLQANRSVLVEVLTPNGWVGAGGGGWINPHPNAGRLGVNATPLSDVYFRVRTNFLGGASLLDGRYYRLWFSTQKYPTIQAP